MVTSASAYIEDISKDPGYAPDRAQLNGADWVLVMFYVMSVTKNLYKDAEWHALRNYNVYACIAEQLVAEEL